MLAEAGHSVHVIARGATLAAIRAGGLRLNDRAPTNVEAMERGQGEPVDVLFIAVKAHSVLALLPAITPIIGAETVIVPMINGIPWWYFGGLSGPYAGQIVQAVDPNGAILATLDGSKIIGAVVYLTAEAPEPGWARAEPPYRVVLGEPALTGSRRLDDLCALLSSAGFDAHGAANIRDEIWTKLVANLASNPLSVVAGATLGDIFGHADLREPMMAVMREAMLVGACYGARFTIDPLRLIEVGRRKGAFKTSTLQDYEKGRPLELSGICDAVLELAERFGIPMPTTKMLLCIARFRSQQTVGGA
jgi:2-dehydropantoate 2-reductase